MQIGTRLLEEKANQYSDEIDDYESEEERLDALPTAFDTGSWTVNDIAWIVKDWKLESLPDAFSDFGDNSDDEIEDAIHQATQRTTISGKLEALRTLNGIEIPVASSILVFMNPDRYTVLDKRAWTALYDIGYVYDRGFDNDSIEDYLVYLGTCRALACEYDVDLRTLDRVLWVMGK